MGEEKRRIGSSLRGKGVLYHPVGDGTGEEQTETSDTGDKDPLSHHQTPPIFRVWAPFLRGTAH